MRLSGSAVLSRRHIRICLGSLWLIDSALQCEPHFFSSGWWHNDLAESVMGQPAPVSRSILWATSLLAPHAVIANVAVIVVQAGIGICLVAGRFQRVAIAVSIPWALGVWWIGEGFGALPTGFALLAGGAPGPVVLYPLIGWLCRPSGGPEVVGGRERPIARTAVAVWFGIWVGGAVLGLPWRVPMARAVQANIEQNGLGQPHWLGAISGATYGTVGSYPLLVPSGLLIAQLCVGLGVLRTRTRPWALGLGMILAALYWIAAQSLGGLAAGATTDLGSGPLLILLAATVGSATGPPTEADRRSPISYLLMRPPDTGPATDA